MRSPVRSTFARWARASNHRRLLEESIRAGATLGAGCIVALGLPKLVGWMVDDPSIDLGLDLGVAMWSGVGLLALGVLVRAVLRYRRRTVDPTSLAHRLDAVHRTEDLWATAIALEDGTVRPDEGLAGMVRERANVALRRVDRPFERFGMPSTSLAGLGIAAALVSVVPVASSAAAEDLAVEASTEPPKVPPLSSETLERLEQQAEALRQLEQRSSLRPEARSALERARAQLEAMPSDPSRSLSRLSRAESALRELADLARKEGLHDPESLRGLSNDEVAERMMKALDQERTDEAAAMAEELARRLEDADESTLDSMAKAMERAAPRSGGPGESQPSEGGSGSEGHRRTAEGLADKLRSGQSGLSRSELRKMAEELARRPGSGSMDRAAERARSEIERARREQLGKMNGGKGPGEGQGEEPGEQGEGQGNAPGTGEGKAPGEEPGEGSSSGPAPQGLPGGKPGPGGGEGSDQHDPGRSLPNASLHAPEHVDAPSDGPPRGAVRAIERFAQGYRDGEGYADVHREYESIAEAAVRREDIPLTRRDYIRRYFQAVRGQ